MNAIKELVNRVPGKTILGSLLIGASFLPHPKIQPYAGLLQSAGTVIGGVGLAHKLEKIRDALLAAQTPTG